MKGFNGDIESAMLENIDFRRVLYTAKHCQIVLMCLRPMEEIGEEVHAGNDQFFRFEHGSGTCIIDDNEYTIRSGTAIIIPAGARHNIINTSDTEELKMYTIYAPAHHKDGVVHVKKADALASKEEFDGQTTE